MNSQTEQLYCQCYDTTTQLFLFLLSPSHFSQHYRRTLQICQLPTDVLRRPHPCWSPASTCCCSHSRFTATCWCTCLSLSHQSFAVHKQLTSPFPLPADHVWSIINFSSSHLYLLLLLIFCLISNVISWDGGWTARHFWGHFACNLTDFKLFACHLAPTAFYEF